MRIAIDGEKSFGATQACVAENAVVVPGAGHWLIRENLAFTIALVQDALRQISAATA